MKKDPIVIVGGGFGGVYTAKRLLACGCPVILISTSNHFTFTPLLHEVATGSLIAQDIVFEYESFFHNNDFEFVDGAVSRIDPEKKFVVVDGREISYSDLVLATGSITNEKLMKGTQHAFALKRAEDALAIKHAILDKAQSAQKRVSITVIGGGPTGCELVFELERFLVALKKRHPTLVSSLRLIHGGVDLAGRVHPSVQGYIKHLLKIRKIEVVYEAYAQDISTTQVITTKGTFTSDVTILTSGVRPNTHFLKGILPMDEQGNIRVSTSLAVDGLEHVYALGDIISMDNIPVPKLAQTAVEEAKIVAQNILLHRSGSPLKPYKPEIKGFLLSLGYGQGAGEVFGVVVKGVLAWYLWRTVYLFKTPGVMNKLRVAFTWTLGLFQGRNLTSL